VIGQDDKAARLVAGQKGKWGVVVGRVVHGG
jgi:hypothetical protein